MIVKTKSGKGTWSYFEGDKIDVKEENLSNTNANSYPDTLMYLKPDTKINVPLNCACGKNHNIGLSICVLKNNEVTARILTNRLTYLLNDSGKTVDKLFY